jgi:branched-chain amino acid transport system ATP-binding protein
VFGELSVRENLQIGGHLLSAKDLKSKMDEIYGLFPDLYPLRSRRAGTLSSGEKQILALGRALMLRPSLLLVDEPSVGLAPRLARSALDCLRGVNERFGTSILLVEQNVREALAVASRVYVLKLGQVVLCDRPVSLTPDVLRRAFLG